jgi:hypothetical protein
MIVSTALNLIVIPALYLIVAGFDRRFDEHDGSPHDVEKSAAKAQLEPV